MFASSHPNGNSANDQASVLTIKLYENFNYIHNLNEHIWFVADGIDERRLDIAVG